MLTGRLPWIALVLAASFGAYGLPRKIASLGALEGLTLETLLLAPLALAYLGWFSHTGAAQFPSAGLSTQPWLAGVGPVTAVPVLMFAAGARRISMTSLGLLQYIGPPLQLGLGVCLFGEPFGVWRFAGFALTWMALVPYTTDSWMPATAPKPLVKRPGLS